MTTAHTTSTFNRPSTFFSQNNVTSSPPADNLEEEVETDVSGSCVKPDIDHLTDAIVFMDDGTPVFVPDVGENVVIERHSALHTGHPWIETCVYIVNGINHETGQLLLWNPDMLQNGKANFIEDPKHGCVFKMCLANQQAWYRKRKSKDVY